MKRTLICLLAVILLLTGCAKPGEIFQPLDKDGMERLPYLKISQEQAKLMMEQDDGHVIVDVRRQDEFDAGHIPGAICIPNEGIGTERPEELPDLNQIILVYCRSGNRSKQAAEKLGKMGYYNVYEFGGIIDWTGEVVTEPVKEAIAVDVPAQETSPKENAPAATAPEEAPFDPDEYTGFYTDDSYDTVVIWKDGDEYRMEVSIYRLTTLNEGTVSISEEGVVFQTVDAALNPMTVSFYREGDRYALRIDESTWPLLEQGTRFDLLVKIEEEGDWIDPADLADSPKGHYTFRPKVCSVYWEELFGKEMCETWFNLVDAVMEGRNTFACPDQHTYDWVMGQFPEKCFPVLIELIDYAYDREHSVIDGVASFTWLVSPEEAAERIRAFGEQIEGILNAALLDDYSDLEKALALYDYFSKNYSYDWDIYYRMRDKYLDEICCLRFFRTGSGICQEISTAYSYLLMQAGVEATVMSGTRSYDLEGHQWSYVRINGKDYHIDPTYVIGNDGSLAYFMMTDEQRTEMDGYEPSTFVITSNYAQDHPHPDYVASDETFRPIWDYLLETFFHNESTMICYHYGDEGERVYLEFDYSGF